MFTDVDRDLGDLLHMLANHFLGGSSREVCSLKVTEHDVPTVLGELWMTGPVMQQNKVKLYYQLQGRKGPIRFSGSRNALSHESEFQGPISNLTHRRQLVPMSFN